MLSTKPPGKSWKEFNRGFKERKRKRQEERLVKKARYDEEVESKASQDKVIAEKITSFEVRKVSTLSIAVPGSILDNAQSQELKTDLAGKIARAACIYQVDEIIVFDDQGEITESERKKIKRDEVFGEARHGCLQLARILQYLECPQYLRKYFFPIHKDLQHAGRLPPLDAPHHLRQQDESLFREGVVSNKPLKAGQKSLVSTIVFSHINFSIISCNMAHKVMYNYLLLVRNIIQIVI